MFTTFEELLKGDKTKTLNKLGQELNRDIVEQVKTLPVDSELRKELNKQRISALNLKLIQGGKA
jgi:hypothetical protein